MRAIKKIILHCSAGHSGNLEFIDKIHRQRGFDSCGYHFVICNGYKTFTDYTNDNRDENLDGLLEVGRPEEIKGAHCKGNNYDSIGISLIGLNVFTSKQFETLTILIGDLIKKYNLTIDDIYPHNYFPSAIKQGKTCPNFNVEDYKIKLRALKWISNLL